VRPLTAHAQPLRPEQIELQFAPQRDSGTVCGSRPALCPSGVSLSNLNYLGALKCSNRRSWVSWDRVRMRGSHAGIAAEPARFGVLLGRDTAQTRRKRAALPRLRCCGSMWRGQCAA
jgi:hypothetical protein